MNQIGNDDYMRYLLDGEIKLVFKTNELPLQLYHPLYDSVDIYWYQEHPQERGRYCSTVKDNTTGEYIALAVLTKRPIDTTTFKLL